MCHAEVASTASQVSYSGATVFNNSTSSQVIIECPYAYTVSGAPFSFFSGTVTALNRTTSSMVCELARFDPRTGTPLGASSVTFPANMTAASMLSFPQPGGTGGNFYMLCFAPPSSGPGLNAWIISSELENNT
jgi:hypothetical protein